MKKFFLIIFPFLILLFFPFSVYAQAMPDISSATYTLVDNSINSLNSSGLSSYGVTPYDNSSVTDTISNFLGLDGFGLDPSDYIIRPLTVLEQEDIESGFTSHFYDESGNEIPLDSLYFVTASNDYFTAKFYIDSAGNVLYDDPYKTNTLLSVSLNDLRFGAVTGQSSWGWNDVYYHLAQQIANNAYNYYPTEEDFIDNTYYVRFGYGDGGGHPIRTGFVYVSNQCIPGTIVPLNTQGYIQSWYTNDPSLITLVFDSGEPLTQQLVIEQGNYSFNNNEYSYFVRLRSDFGGGRTDVSFSDFLTGNYTVSNVRAFTFERSSYFYGEQSSIKTVPYRPTKTPEVPYISPDEYYNYDELTRLQPESVPEVNPDFDPASEISPDNYPVYYVMPDGIVYPSTLPLPGVSELVNPIPVPSDNPVIELDPESPIGSNVPFINNLMNRFPFSIPWDLARLVNGFVISPAPPAWDFDYSITVLGHTYTTHFQGDLSAFNSLAELLRTLELIAFLIFLCFISYKYFF